MVRGISLFCPAHNNACQGTNGWVKDTHTKRIINSVSRFLKVLFDIIWSEIGRCIGLKIRCLNLLILLKKS